MDHAGDGAEQRVRRMPLEGDPAALDLEPQRRERAGDILPREDDHGGTGAEGGAGEPHPDRCRNGAWCATVVEIDEHETEPVRIENVQRRAQRVARRARTDPEDAREIDAGALRVRRVEGVLEIDARGEIVTRGDRPQQRARERGASRGRSSDDLRQRAAREPTPEERVERVETGRRIPGTSRRSRKAAASAGPRGMGKAVSPFLRLRSTPDSQATTVW
jgi:hypothetical protein